MSLNFNFLHNAFDEDPKDKQKKIKFLKKLFYPLIFFGVFILIFSFQVILTGDSFGQSFSSGIKKLNFFNSLSFASDKTLKGEENDRINILLLGMGGLGHSGPFLTDTIILASYRPSTNEIALLSIPRDLSIPIPQRGWRKINSVNHYGEMDSPGQGGEYTRQILSDLLDIDIPYYFRVDFQGFKEVIDELGGVEIYVDKSFTDSSFPDENFGYQTISFEQGWAKMDGERALQYARSRHGTNGESSDFARSQRQQKVIKAVKDKATSLGTLFNPRKLNALYQAYNKNVTTNLETWEIIRLAKMTKDVPNENIKSLVLSNGPDGLLYSRIINGAYLLLPKDDSFYEIQQVVKNIFANNPFLIRDERPTIEIRNGTRVDGLAYRTSLDLKQQGFNVIKIGNALQQDYEISVIYDLTQGQKPNALAKLKEEFDANVSYFIPDHLTSSNAPQVKESQADFLLILGMNHFLKQED